MIDSILCVQWQNRPYSPTYDGTSRAILYQQEMQTAEQSTRSQYLKRALGVQSTRSQYTLHQRFTTSGDAAELAAQAPNTRTYGGTRRAILYESKGAVEGAISTLPVQSESNRNAPSTLFTPKQGNAPLASQKNSAGNWQEGVPFGVSNVSTAPLKPAGS